MENTEEFKAFMEYVESYIPIQRCKAKRWPAVPALVLPEFTEEDWEHIKITGDWRALKQKADVAIAEVQQK